ncbi:hypothetical protein NFJ02_40g105850 [Pycnococcus provasolii]
MASLVIMRAYASAPPAGGALTAPFVGARRADWCDATCREHLIVAKSATELVEAYKKVKKEWEEADSGSFVPANVAYACGTWTLSLAKKASHRWNYGVHKASSAREIVDDVQSWNESTKDKNTMWYLVSATAGDGEWIFVVKGEDAGGGYRGKQQLIDSETVALVKMRLDVWFSKGWMAEHIVYGNGGWLVVACAGEAGSSQLVVVAEDSADKLHLGIVKAYALAVQSGKNYRVANLVGDGKCSGVAVMVSTNSTASVAEKVDITRGISDIHSHLSDGYKAEPSMYLRAIAVMGDGEQVTCLQTDVVKEFKGGEEYSTQHSVSVLRELLDENSRSQPWLSDAKYKGVHMLVCLSDRSKAFVNPDDSRLSSLEAQLGKQKSQCSTLKTQLAERDARIASLEKSIAGLERELKNAHSTKEDKELKTQLAERDANIASLEKSIAGLERELKNAQSTKEDKEAILKEAEEQMAQHVASLSKLSASERKKRLKAMMREYHPDKKIILPWLFTKISALVSGHLNKPFV